MRRYLITDVRGPDHLFHLNFNSAQLGEGGNLVLAGHVDWDGTRGQFWALGTLAQGDSVEITGADGLRRRYAVDWSREYPESSLAGIAALQPQSGLPTLTLVTCGGRFDLRTRSYLDRRVVRASLVGDAH